MQEKRVGQRRTGAAYRRAMERKHRRRQMEIIRLHPLWGRGGYVDWVYVHGVQVFVGNHIQYPRDSRRQKYLKNQSDRRLRRQKEAYQYGQYRRCYEYWWSLY